MRCRRLAICDSAIPYSKTLSKRREANLALGGECLCCRLRNGSESWTCLRPGEFAFMHGHPAIGMVTCNVCC